MNESESQKENSNKILQEDELTAIEAIYGQDWTKELDSGNYSITINPDVRLFITFTVGYPVSEPPRYELLAPKLSKSKKSTIDNEFSAIYDDNRGEPIIFQWIEALKTIVNEKEDEEQIEEPTNQNLIILNRVKANFDEIAKKVTHGNTITDRKSVFQAHACRIEKEQEAHQFLSYLMQNKKIAQATHNISAYRICLPNNVVLQDCNDDGEAHAGGRLLHLLEITKVQNVMVVVSRWYGGILLGPDRFKHINNAARQVLQQGGFME